LALDRAIGHRQSKRIGEVSIFRKLAFDLWYLRHPPWDNGTVPPEVKEFISNNTPDRAMDLGCGTGTSSQGLAQAGWKVIGVDFAKRAIRIAKQKAQAANLNVEFLVGDVTHLPITVFSHRYDLLLDIGCFQGLSVSGKTCYLNQLEHLLAPNGTWLLYGFFKPEESPIPSRIPDNLKIFPLKLIERKNGMEKLERPSAWFWYKKQ
jgi:SAM-dependent methyltransferase